jgi:hypothetical protein
VTLADPGSRMLLPADLSVPLAVTSRRVARAFVSTVSVSRSGPRRGCRLRLVLVVLHWQLGSLQPPWDLPSARGQLTFICRRPFACEAPSTPTRTPAWRQLPTPGPRPGVHCSDRQCQCQCQWPAQARGPLPMVPACCRPPPRILPDLGPAADASPRWQEAAKFPQAPVRVTPLPQAPTPSQAGTTGRAPPPAGHRDDTCTRSPGRAVPAGHVAQAPSGNFPVAERPPSDKPASES